MLLFKVLEHGGQSLALATNCCVKFLEVIRLESQVLQTTFNLFLKVFQSRNLRQV